MYSSELKTVLIASQLFTDNEINRLLSFVGAYSIGNAVVACHILGISLIGNDIDILYSVGSDYQ